MWASNLRAFDHAHHARITRSTGCHGPDCRVGRLSGHAYPPESRHVFDLAGLKQPNVLFAVARTPSVCNRLRGDRAPSRIWRAQADVCQPRRQGRGLARQLLSLLETSAVSRGCKLLRLETGPYQQEALALYASAGFERRGPFGDYADDPLRRIHAEARRAGGAASSVGRGDAGARRRAAGQAMMGTCGAAPIGKWPVRRGRLEPPPAPHRAKPAFM